MYRRSTRQQVRLRNEKLKFDRDYDYDLEACFDTMYTSASAPIPVVIPLPSQSLRGGEWRAANARGVAPLGGVGVGGAMVK